MKAVVTGMIATFPVGGVAWDYGQYALGLERLGFDVWYLEDTGCESYDPDRMEYGQACDYGVRFLADALQELSPGLAARWHVRCADGSTHGLDPGCVPDLVAEADLFLNVSGGCLMRDEYLPSRVKVLVDTDPGWNHFVVFPHADSAPEASTGHSYRAHDAFFTYAVRLGRPDCPLPNLGLDWQPTRPPVVVDRWSTRPPGERWTTILTWDNYGHVIEHEGVEYGSKGPELARVEDLPQRVDAQLEIAAGGVQPPRERWRERGWSVIDSHTVSRTPGAYRAYVEGSRGELSVAKNVYVATRSGWFSCRSVCYLAAGRPAVLQDTGFSESVPVGEGLFAFSDAGGAAAALRAVEHDYDAHANAARELAAREFGSHVVLSELLERAGVG